MFRLAQPRSLVEHAVGRTVDSRKLCADHQASGRPHAMVGTVRVPRPQHGWTGGQAVRSHLPGARRETRVSGHRRTSGHVSRRDHVERTPGRGSIAETRKPEDQWPSAAAGVRLLGSVGPRQTEDLRTAAWRRARQHVDGPVCTARACGPIPSGQRRAAGRAVQPMVFGCAALGRGVQGKVPHAADQGVGQRRVLRRSIRSLRGIVQTEYKFPYGQGGGQS